jgi:plasmid stabilization system protein ParE
VAAAAFYEVQITDTADAEADRLALWLAGQTTAEHAARWYAGLIEAIGELSDQPRLHPVARENDLYADEVTIRRMLYYGVDEQRGTRRRSGRNPYRIVFHIIEPAEPDAGEPGTVRVLHIYHGAERPQGPANGDEDDKDGPNE